MERKRQPSEKKGGRVDAKSTSDESRLKGLMEMSTEAIISADEQQRIVLFNRGAVDMFGYSMNEALGQPLSMLLPMAARDAHAGLVAGVIAQGHVSRRMSERKPVHGRRKNGDEFEAEISFSTLPLERGSVATAVVRDVSALRAAEAALQQSEARYRNLVEASPAGIFTAALDGVILDGNASFASMLGAPSPAELRGESLRRRLARPEEWDGIANTVATSGQYALAEHTIRRQGDQVAQLLLKAVRGQSTDGSTTVVHGFVLDVTERRRLEEVARRSEQFDAVGKLAGGVVHDFNNLLTVIRMCAAFLAEESSLSVAARNDVVEIDRAAVRASDLTAQLLAFGRRQPVPPRPVDFRKIAERNTELMRRLFGEAVALRVRLCEAPALIVADEAQLERVLVNLVTNARDAMPAAGSAEITIAIAEPPADIRARCPRLGTGSHVCLTVRDSGVGMDDATRARIFEPFFTTKGPTGGTGLGLASVKGIVTESGGDVAVDSAPGKGTAVHLWFPAAREVPVEPLAGLRTRASDAAFTLPLSVLVIEDESGVRILVERLLKSRGITVLTAHDGHSALRLVEAHAGPIDAVVSDIVLPDMSGQKAVDRIAEHHPDIGVLFISGYSADTVEHRGRLRPGSELIGKPLAPDDFLARLALALNRPPIA